jgi:hypothetical protein
MMDDDVSKILCILAILIWLGVFLSLLDLLAAP